MERLDYKYLAGLVLKAQNGGSNAFAELYTATYQNEFEYSYEYFQDEAKAKEALKASFVRALQEINKLKEADLVIPWLYKLNFETCQGIKFIGLLQENGHEASVEDFENITISGKSYRLAQLNRHLPMTEAQVLIMHYYQQYPVKEIARLLGLGKRYTKQAIKSGQLHLKQLLREDND